MAAKSKAGKAASAEHPHLAALRLQEKKLEKKIKERIPTFPEETREGALQRAELHLEGVRNKIKQYEKAKE